MKRGHHITVTQAHDVVPVHPEDTQCQGATHKSIIARELVTALGEALTWICDQCPFIAVRYEICSDSYYVTSWMRSTF